MNAATKRVQRMVSCAVAVAAAMPLMTYHTLGAQSATRLADEPARHRFVVTLVAQGPGRRVIAGGHMDHSAMVHRFRVEILDSMNAPAASAEAWEVTVFADTSPSAAPPAIEPMVQLSAQVRDVNLPRPFGCHLHFADSLLVIATFGTTAAARGLRLRVTVDYEPVEQSRMAVWTVPGARDTAAAALQTWEWRPGMAGEMVAITGLSLAGADRLVLEDVASGEVLWRSHAAADASKNAGESGQTVRPSAVVAAGRVYRLTVSYIKAAARATASNHGAALAIVRPARFGQ